MKTLLAITYAIPVGDQTLHFGSPDTLEEVRKMHQLRYQIYVTHQRYLPTSFCPDSLEIDVLDRTGGCAYFIVQCGAQVVGTVRRIHQRPLPIDTHWQYVVSDDLQGVRPEETVEISRLAVDHAAGIMIPPRLVPLGLLLCATRFSLALGIGVGYATPQVRLVRHMERWGLLVRRLESARYTGEEPFPYYWTNAAAPVCPAYFHFAEVDQSLDRWLEHKLVFKQTAAAHYRYRPRSGQ